MGCSGFALTFVASMPDQKGCLPLAVHARDHGEHGRCLTLFMHGLEEWVLASQNG